jgi:hypothetical protein
MKTRNSHTSLFLRAISAALIAIFLIGQASAQQSFQITSLSTSNSNLIEHGYATGDDRGGIALSSTSIFYTGDDSTGSFPTSNLSTGSATSFQHDALVSNLRTKQVYALGTQFGLVGYGGDLVTRLVPLDPTTGAEIAGDVLLSVPLSITNGSTSAGIFSGWDRIVLLDGGSLIAYNIDLPSGIVTSLGPVNLYTDNGSADDRCGCENWATWGVAEYSGGTIKLVYAASPYSGFGINSIKGFLPGSIKRYDVSTGDVTTVADFPMGVSDMCSITVDPAADRWYFHYEGYSGAFDFGSDENIGYATASFLAPSSARANISGRVLAHKGRGLSGVIVKAVSPSGKVTSTTTNTYGNYTLKGLKVGESYVVSVESRRYYFPVSSEVVQLDADLAGLDFEAF